MYLPEQRGCSKRCLSTHYQEVSRSRGLRVSCLTGGYRFLADKYKLDMSSAANISNLSNAIKRGAEKGQLTLPSGIAGRVKAGPKVGKLALSFSGTSIDVSCRSLLLFSRSRQVARRTLLPRKRSLPRRLQVLGLESMPLRRVLPLPLPSRPFLRRSLRRRRPLPLSRRLPPLRRLMHVSYYRLPNVCPC